MRARCAHKLQRRGTLFVSPVYGHFALGGIMKRILSRAVLFGCTLIMLTGAGGCMRRRSKTDKMVEYMNAKYDDRFEYAAPFGGGVGAATAQITVSSEKLPGAQIWVEYYEKDGKEFFADNYIAYKYEQQTREALAQLLESIFMSGVKLRFSIGTKGMANDFNDDTAFDEFKGSYSALIGFRAFVSSDYSIADREAVGEKVKAAFTDNGLVASGSIYFANEPGQYETAFDLPFSVLDALPHIQFAMDGAGSFYRFEWGS